MSQLFKFIALASLLAGCGTVSAASAADKYSSDSDLDTKTAAPDAAVLAQELIEAAEIDDLETVLSLIDKGADVNAVDPIGWTALMHACQFKHRKNTLAIVKALLENGAGDSIDAVDRFDFTALMYACASQNPNSLAIVQLLLANGALAQVDAALSYATSVGNTALVELLVNYLAGAARYEGCREEWLKALARAHRSTHGGASAAPTPGE